MFTFPLKTERDTRVNGHACSCTCETNAVIILTCRLGYKLNNLENS